MAFAFILLTFSSVDYLRRLEGTQPVDNGKDSADGVYFTGICVKIFNLKHFIMKILFIILQLRNRPVKIVCGQVLRRQSKKLLTACRGSKFCSLAYMIILAV